MYETVAPGEILSQGDLIDECPLITIRTWPPDQGPNVLSVTWTIRVVVLTQACDLAQHFGTTYTRIALPEPPATQP